MTLFTTVDQISQHAHNITVLICAGSSIIDGRVRLADGNTKHEGRVEIYHKYEFTFLSWKIQ